MSEGMIVRRGGGGSSGSSELRPYGFNEVNFYDYDGTLLYAFTLYEIQDMDELPPGPDHTDEGLIFDDWNWTLEQLQAMTMPVDVGALYDTAPYTFTYNGTEMTLEHPAVVKFTLTSALSSWKFYWSATGTTYFQLDNRSVQAVTPASTGLAQVTFNGGDATQNLAAGSHTVRIIPAAGVTFKLGGHVSSRSTYDRFFNQSSSIYFVAFGTSCTGFGDYAFDYQDHIRLFLIPKRSGFTFGGAFNRVTPPLETFIIPPDVDMYSMSTANSFNLYSQ